MKKKKKGLCNVKAPEKEIPGPQMAELEKFAKYLKRNYHILYNLFQKVEERILPNSFYEAIVIISPKPDKGSTKKETTSQYLL